MRAGIEALKAQGVDDEFTAMDPYDLPFACDDALVTTDDRRPPVPGAKMAALRAHGTQVSVDGGFFALADNVAPRHSAWSTTGWRTAAGAAPGQQWETDLFAGIEE